MRRGVATVFSSRLPALMQLTAPTFKRSHVGVPDLAWPRHLRTLRLRGYACHTRRCSAAAAAATWHPSQNACYIRAATVLTGLQDLALSAVALDRQGGGALADVLLCCPGITRLRLADFTCTRAAAQAALEAAPLASSLQELLLCADAIMMLQSLPAPVPGSGAAPLPALTSLAIRRASSRCHQDYAESVPGLLQCAGTGGVALANKLPLLTALRQLSLAGARLQSKFVQDLASALPKLPRLCHLDLSDNGIYGDSRRLADALERCAALTHLDLSSNCMWLRRAVLPRAFRGTTALRQLHAKDVIGAGYGWSHMCAVSHLQHLTLLHAGECGWGFGQRERIQAALLCVTALRELRLPSGHFTDPDVAVVARLLPALAALSHVDLANNLIQDQGAEDLGYALPQAVSLRKLDLSGNEVDGPGALALAAGAAILQLACEVDLQRNPISGQQRELIDMALEDSYATVRI